MKRTSLNRKKPMQDGPSADRMEHARAEPILKVKTCTAPKCGREFVPLRPLQNVCSPVCARRKVDAEKKAESARFLERKEHAKPRSKWLAECQAIINKIARLRDKDDGCISCHMGPNYGGQWHGSHFRSVGAASSLRFHLWNIHKSCAQCNKDKSGNIAAYRPRLIEKIGTDRVAWLESQNQVVKHTIDYLKRFKAVMGKRLRRMEKRA